MLLALCVGCQSAPPPDFTFSLSAPSLTVAQGSSAQVTVTLERQGGFNEAVAVTLAGLPSGVTPASLTVPASASSATLTLNASASAEVVNARSVTVQAASGGLTKSGAFALTVKAPDPDFSFTVTSSATELTQGRSALLTMRVTRIAGFAGTVQFALQNPPAGLSAKPVTAGCASGASCLTLTAAPNTTVNQYDLQIRGSSGTLERSAGLGVRVTRATDVTISSLTALKMAAPAPFAADFAWVATGASGRTLTCSLDYGDGTAPATPSPCATGTASRTYTAPGTYQATLTVTDNLGFSDSKTLLLNAVDPNATDLFFTRLEWGQSILKPDLRLVAGKDAVLRAFVTASKAGIAGVVVRATGTVGGQTLGSIDLRAPASVPTTDAQGDLNGNYWGIIPKAWIKPGLEVRVTIDPANTVAEAIEDNNAMTLKPEVGAGNKLFLTMVPVVAGGVTPSLTDAARAALREGLMEFWPLADVDITVRAPYTAKDASSTSNVLSEMSALRTADDSDRYYYGFYSVGGGIGFVGYPVSAGSPSLRVVAHELGHNFGQWHAPCGNPSGIDQNYPYAGGSIGSWGFDPSSNTLVNPATFKDIMGYCGTNWVSDYMYRRVQRFLEQFPSSPSAGGAATDLLLVSGSIERGVIALNPVQRITGTPRAPVPGLYSLTLETASGVQRVSFDANTVDHEDGSSTPLNVAHFSFTVPDPGAISALSITGAGVAPLALRSSARVTTQGVSPAISLTKNGSSLTVRWNAGLYPTAGVAYIAPDGARTTLALGLTSGEARLEAGNLGAGRFEVSLSDGLNSVKQQF